MDLPSSLVYSSERGEVQCPQCHKVARRCNCSEKQSQKSNIGPIQVRREVAGRKGKPVITLRNVPLSEKELKALASYLKQKCGTGGSCKSGTIEIQGDHREIILQENKKKGYSAKWSGG